MDEDRAEREDRGPNPRKLWKNLVKAQQEGVKLNEEELRALEIRKTVLSVVHAVDQLIEDPTVKRDPVREAELTAVYWGGMFKLMDFGLKKHMHTGDKPSSFNNPTKMAEYVAGQILDIEERDLTNIRQALMLAQEHSERKRDIGGSNAYLMPTKNIPPALRNFIILRSMVNLTHSFLASDLDKPQSFGSPETPR